MNKTDRVMAKFALPLIALAGVLLIIAIASSTKTTSEQNNAYIRVINCIVSYPATSRTQDDVEGCYRTVEREMNTRLQRYDNSRK